MTYLDDADRARVTAAVAAAEANTDGEIVTIVARRSDDYHDVAAHWAVLTLLGMLALLAIRPAIAIRCYDLFAGPWATAPSPRALFTLALVLTTLAFLFVYLLFKWRPLRLLLTPPATRTRRVRRRALDLFKTAAEARTKGRTGILLYLSLDERRAELIADAAIHGQVTADTWGDAMAALLTGVKAGRPGDGMADALARIGTVLADHVPRSEGDTNELPDRLIEL